MTANTLQTIKEQYLSLITILNISKKLKPFLNEAKTHYAFQSNSIVKNAYRELLALREHATEEDVELALKQYLHLILLQMKYALPEQDTAQPLHATLSQILQYIDEHLHEEMSTETLASAFFVSPSWIYYAFKKHLGVSLSTYVNNKKVLLAQQLIQRHIFRADIKIIPLSIGNTNGILVSRLNLINRKNASYSTRFLFNRAISYPRLLSSLFYA